MNSILAEKYFFRWRDIIAGRRYREWREIQDEFAAECEFAMKNDMETEFWCWNCKHSDCDVHKIKFKEPRVCTGKTQRGRNCHIKATSFINGVWQCRFHA